MANKQRGEVEIKLGGKTWTMRPTFQSLAEIEDRTGLGIIELAQRFWEGRFGILHVTAIVWAGIRAAHDDAPDYDDVGRMVVEHGLPGIAEPIGAFLASILTGQQGKGARRARKPAAPGAAA